MPKKQPKNLIIIIDFDNVLFDRNGKFARASKKAGVDLSSGAKLYQQIKAENNGVYNFKKHLKLIANATSMPLYKLEQNMKQVFQKAPEFLFKGVDKILENLRQQADKLILASRGNFYFQNEKIANSGLSKFFDEIVISEKPKTEALAGQITAWHAQNKTMLFIDDNLIEIKAVKKIFPYIKCLRIKQGSQHSLKKICQSQFL